MSARCVIWGAAGALAAAIPAVWMWGFTVDDALISIRYARHVAAGLGWRFNADGPSTDGVTPLPWPALLALAAKADAGTVLRRAQQLGLAMWTATGAALGVSLGRVQGGPRWAPAPILATTALSVPLAAYAVSGMETPVATLLATAAVLSGRVASTALLAGLAAAFRPELAAWALAVSLGTALIAAPRDVPSSGNDGAPAAGASFGAAARTTSPAAESLPRRGARLAVAVGLALAPSVACALVRTFAWGRPVPLALLAKPSDLRFGVPYAGAACVVTLVPLLVLAPSALWRAPRALVLVVAALVHAAAIALVGGDWMPYARLAVPVVPSLAYAAGLLAADARRGSRVRFACRALAAVAVGGVLVVRGGTRGRAVSADRQALIAAARRWLAPARQVAAIDIGWVGAATEAHIVDLAGLTDPNIAALPGGHTSKRVGPTLLLDRGVDTLLLYAAGPVSRGSWREGSYPRRLEARLAADDVVARHFVAVAFLPLGGAGYVVLRRVDDAELRRVDDAELRRVDDAELRRVDDVEGTTNAPVTP